MQRRSFFGVLGGLLAFLGWEKKAKASSSIDGIPVEDLPVIEFDKMNGQITNRDELIQKSRRVAKTYSPYPDNTTDKYEYFIVKAWLPARNSIFAQTSPFAIEQIYGPVYVRMTCRVTDDNGRIWHRDILYKTDWTVVTLSEQKNQPILYSFRPFNSEQEVMDAEGFV